MTSKAAGILVKILGVLAFIFGLVLLAESAEPIKTYSGKLIKAADSLDRVVTAIGVLTAATIAVQFGNILQQKRSLVPYFAFGAIIAVEGIHLFWGISLYLFLGIFIIVGAFMFEGRDADTSGGSKPLRTGPSDAQLEAFYMTRERERQERFNSR